MIYVLILLAVGALGLWMLARMARQTEDEKGIGDRPDGPVLGGARLGPDGTNVDPPESFVVHHEGKGQGLDIANTALTQRSEVLTSDLPGEQRTLKAPIPGRQHVHGPVPSDESPFGDVKVPPLEGGDTKDRVLREGPIGSRPGTAEEPGGPNEKGRRITFDRQHPFGLGQTTNMDDQNGWSGPNDAHNANTNKTAAGPGTSVEGGFTATPGPDAKKPSTDKQAAPAKAGAPQVTPPPSDPAPSPDHHVH